MRVNEKLDDIMEKWRISNVYLSKMTGIDASTISRYRNNQRNIGEKSFAKIFDALIELEVNKKILKELKREYEVSRNKKIFEFGIIHS